MSNLLFNNLLSLWQRLTNALGFVRLPKHTYRFDGELAWSLQALAEREQRAEEEIAAELLAFALAHRRAAEVNLACWKALTQREKQVAALLCLNYANNQIAERLVISPETVKSHVRNVLHKFKVRSRTDLRLMLADWDFSAWEEENPLALTE